ncbi:MAG: hypothetical protein ABWZ25_00030 [Chitinophagaceae bacterium]
MKKLTAILFLHIYLFNLAGYQFVFDHSKRRLDQQSITSLDRGNYSTSDLIEVKIPLSLPYYSQHYGEYERCDGEIEVNGVLMDFVSRKVSGDTLYLLCLPNMAKTEMQEARNCIAGEFGQPSGDNPIVKKMKADNECLKLVISCQLMDNTIDPASWTDQVPSLVSCVIGIRPEPPRSHC